jgi:Carboxypeptidase regulatory-like domain
MARLLMILAILAVGLFAPTSLTAQGVVTGVVKDMSSAVLPGVTVEAASPALIEKARIALTDGTGRYEITDLRPGTYTVTFTLRGFSVVKREGIQLTGAFTATVDAELPVGAFEETITIRKATPVVDLQSATRQRVFDQELIAMLPTGRNPFNLAVLIPGVSDFDGLFWQDVGGTGRAGAARPMVIHGSRPNDQRLTMNGVPMSNMSNGGSNTLALPTATGVQEMTVDTAAVSADLATGGVRINFIPNDGGNQFRGVVFASFANDTMQNSNYTTELQQQGLAAPGGIKKNWDINPGFGGPIARDRVWFYVTARSRGAHFFVPGMFYNRNANKPDLWAFEPDTTRPAIIERTWEDGQGRLTWHATAKHKFGLQYDYQTNCACPGGITATIAPEASADVRGPLLRAVQLDWTFPLSTRLFLQASGSQRAERSGTMHLQTNGNSIDPAMISVVEQGQPIPFLTYRANLQYDNSWSPTFYWRIALSYVTGSHVLKAGFNDGWGRNDTTIYAHQPYAYQFTNGVPNQVTLRATPYTQSVVVDHDLGAYVQDKWTVDRWTTSFGLRYDYFRNGFPDQRLAPGPLVPTRDLMYPARSNLSWHDITPKSGLSYDLLGNGKVVLKTSLNKYLAGYGTASSGIASTANPIASLALTANRAWTDGNRNYVPDCDLLNPSLQNNLAGGGDLCGAFNNTAFGKPDATTTFDPNLLEGWSKRDFNWEFSAGMQHEILPRVSVDLSYFRRWYGNFQVTDNRAVSPADYDTFSITAPMDSRLPDGGGYLVSGLYNVKPTKFGQVDNFVTFAKNYGKEAEHWNGVDISTSARLQNGLVLQGGLSTGRTTIDACEITVKLPETLQGGAAVRATVDMNSWFPASFCLQKSPFLAQLKAFGAYTVPNVQVLVAGTFQSLPGTQINANYAAPNAVVAPSLGRSLSGNAPNIQVHLVRPGTVYNDRLYQFDLRISKVFRFGRTRSTIGG